MLDAPTPANTRPALPHQKWRFRPCKTGDSATPFGIQAGLPGGVWHHVAIKGVAAVFAAAEERDAEMTRLVARHG